MKEPLVFLRWGCGQGKFRKEEASELGFIECVEVYEAGKGHPGF